jgi:hypothetical protein
VITDVPRPRPPYLNRFVSRHGKVMWVVRVGSGAERRRVFIRAEYGTSEFQAEYEAALSGASIIRADGKARAGTLAWLIDRYRETHAWASLSTATRRQRENIFKQATKTAGNAPATEITKASITAGRDRRSATPAQARHFLQTMRSLFRWALEAGHVRVDPTHGVSDLKLHTKKAAKGFPIWTDEDVEKYTRRWPIGTRQRVWLDILLLYRPAARRRCTARKTAREGRCSYDPHREERRRDRGLHPDPARARHHAQSRAVRRSCLHRRRERTPADEGELRQFISEGMPRRWRVRLGTRTAQGGRDQGGEQRRHGR